VSRQFTRPPPTIAVPSGASTEIADFRRAQWVVRPRPGHTRRHPALPAVAATSWSVWHQLDRGWAFARRRSPGLHWRRWVFSDVGKRLPLCLLSSRSELAITIGTGWTEAGGCAECIVDHLKTRLRSAAYCRCSPRSIRASPERRRLASTCRAVTSTCFASHPTRTHSLTSCGAPSQTRRPPRRTRSRTKAGRCHPDRFDARLGAQRGGAQPHLCRQRCQALRLPKELREIDLAEPSGGLPTPWVRAP
jgi:hypothetical protein